MNRAGTVYIGLVHLCAPRTGSLKQVQDLVQKMNDGKVEVLFIHGVNPIFELPDSSR